MAIDLLRRIWNSGRGDEEGAIFEDRAWSGFYTKGSTERELLTGGLFAKQCGEFESCPRRWIVEP
jgi:hypothetical protein